MLKASMWNDEPGNDVPRRRSGWTQYHPSECHARSHPHLTLLLRCSQRLRGPRKADEKRGYPYRGRRHMFPTFVGIRSLWRRSSCARYEPNSKVRCSALLEVRESLRLAEGIQSDRLRYMLPRMREHVSRELINRSHLVTKSTGLYWTCFADTSA
jgi:hypothetical protein